MQIGEGFCKVITAYSKLVVVINVVDIYSNTSRTYMQTPPPIQGGMWLEYHVSDKHRTDGLYCRPETQAASSSNFVTALRIFK